MSTSKKNTFAESMQKAYYWVNLFKEEQDASPSKIIASKLMFYYLNVIALLKEAKNQGNEEEKAKVELIESLIPSQEALLALFVVIQKKHQLSSKDLGRFSVEMRSELLAMRNEEKRKAKKQEFQGKLEKVLTLLETYVE